MDGFFEDLSMWAKSIFVGLLARGFPAKDDVVNEIIEPALRSRRLSFSSGGCDLLLLGTLAWCVIYISSAI